MRRHEDDSTPQEKVLFIGILLCIMAVVMIGLQWADDSEKRPIVHCGHTIEPAKERWILPDTIRVTRKISSEQRYIHWTIKDQRQFELEKAIEDYIEDNPDLINDYLGR